MKIVPMMLLLLSTTEVAFGGILAQQTDRIFDEMLLNKTSSGFYKSSRRGVLAGGSVVQRNRIMDVQLISFAPPHINAGCGGIDLFAGSFSYINSQQLVQLMRSIAANATGYAFALALGEMSPEILSIIQWLQGVMNRLNLAQANSCQLAQGLVNDFTGGIWSESNRARTSASVVGSLSGWYNDYHDAMHQSGKDNVLSTMKENDPDSFNQIIAGNVIYQALKNSNVVAALGYGNNQDGIEELMAITGLVIIDLAKVQAQGGNEELDFIEKPALIEFDDLLMAGEDYQERIYHCLDSDCLEVTTLNRSPGGFVNMTGRIERLLCGQNLDGGRDSVIWKYTHGADFSAQLTSAQQALLDSSPILAMAMHDLGLSSSTDLLYDFVHEYSKVLSAQVVHDIVQQIFRASRLSLSQSGSRNISRAMEVLNRSEEHFNRQYQDFMHHHGGIHSLQQRLEYLRQRIDPQLPKREQ